MLPFRHDLIALYCLLHNIDGKYYDNKLYEGSIVIRTLTKQEHIEKLTILAAEADAWFNVEHRQDLVTDILDNFNITKLYNDDWRKDK